MIADCETARRRFSSQLKLIETLFPLQPLRYARLEKADILEMVVKHLKDVKKRRQTMIAAMEPILFRSFKMGYMDCTRATIDFISEIESPGNKKQTIIDHITQECMKTFQSRSPPASFNQHHEIAFSNVNPSDQFIPFPLLSTSLDGEMEWPSLEERLGFSPIGHSSFLLPDVKPQAESLTASLLKVVEPRASAFNFVTKLSSMESPSTSAASALLDVTPLRSISILDDTSDDDEDDEDKKLIIDDPNNNHGASWRPWL